MALKKTYVQFSKDFRQFRFNHKLGGVVIVFLMNMGIWSLAARVSNEPYFSSLFTQLLMSVIFTAVFYVGNKPE